MASARAPLVGSPVVVVDDGIHGRFFNAQVQEHLMSQGDWSDGLCECWRPDYCGTGDWWFVLLCPSCAVYTMLSRIGSVDTRCGRVSAQTIGILMIVCLISDLSRFCAGIGIATTALLLSVVLLGISLKAGINESALTVICKALFCSTCFYSQMCRHVDRMQGFLRYTGEVPVPMTALTQVSSNRKASGELVVPPTESDSVQISADLQDTKKLSIASSEISLDSTAGVEASPFGTAAADAWRGAHLADVTWTEATSVAGTAAVAPTIEGRPSISFDVPEVSASAAAGRGETSPQAQMAAKLAARKNSIEVGRISVTPSADAPGAAVSEGDRRMTFTKSSTEARDSDFGMSDEQLAKLNQVPAAVAEESEESSSESEPEMKLPATMESGAVKAWRGPRGTIHAGKDDLEAEVVMWLEAVSGEIRGDQNLATWLNNGQLLCKVVNIVQPGTIKKINLQDMPFKKMENIKAFTEACRKVGVGEREVFATPDLYEEKNLRAVLMCIFSFASVIRTSVPSFGGPYLGVKRNAVVQDEKRQVPTASQMMGGYRLGVAPPAISHRVVGLGLAGGSFTKDSFPSPRNSCVASPRNCSDGSPKAGGADRFNSPSLELPSPAAAAAVAMNRFGARSPEESPAPAVVDRTAAQSASEEEVPFGATGSIGRRPTIHAVGADLEAEVTMWLEAVTEEDRGDRKFGEWLHDGQLLCRAVNQVQPNTIKKINKQSMPFKQMENISQFLGACRQLGVLEKDCFSTPDLFEEKNLRVVMLCIYSFAAVIRTTVPTFAGPYLGVKRNAKLNTPKAAKRDVDHFSMTSGLRQDIAKELKDGARKGRVAGTAATASATAPADTPIDALAAAAIAEEPAEVAKAEAPVNAAPASATAPAVSAKAPAPTASATAPAEAPVEAAPAEAPARAAIAEAPADAASAEVPAVAVIAEAPAVAPAEARVVARAEAPEAAMAKAKGSEETQAASSAESAAARIARENRESQESQDVWQAAEDLKKGREAVAAARATEKQSLQPVTEAPAAIAKKTPMVMMPMSFNSGAGGSDNDDADDDDFGLGTFVRKDSSPVGSFAMMTPSTGTDPTGPQPRKTSDADRW